VSYGARPKEHLNIRLNGELREEAKETAEHHIVLRDETEARNIEHVTQYNTTGWQHSDERGTRKFL
jgi:hypothetical protein